ncbi:hypothetical protein PPTG_24587 [Phytophthora nicotianae INRA-310]|uniref:Uncharacterized protein n=1 Tax=Phytophthora nicotianae (strain INRA-310) TaxID=761204 RepID=W2PEY2_PHYN3|nr:hypothetical protein PPTG_24587 [Phytophthora nicotianae INRA-310]ETM98559.1 hypothetical protein PPTG_24587 [Phytophthora nicotianae INRA-310]
MRQLLELRSLGDLRVLPGRVWRDVKDEMIREYGERSGLRFLPKQEAIGVIRRCRDAATGADAFRAIETEQVRRISDDDEREFLQMNLAYPMEGKFRRIVGFGHPDLIRLMKYPGITLFVDATLSVTPKPFT